MSARKSVSVGVRLSPDVRRFDDDEDLGQRVAGGIPLELPDEAARLVADAPVEVGDLRDVREDLGHLRELRAEQREGVEDLELVVGLPLRRLEELEEGPGGPRVAHRAERADGGERRQPVVQEGEDPLQDVVPPPVPADVLERPGPDPPVGIFDQLQPDGDRPGVFDQEGELPRGPRERRIGGIRELQERRDEAGVAADDRLERPVADPDERPLESLQEPGGEDVGGDPGHEREGPLSDRLVSVGEEGEDLARVVALGHREQPLERSERRLHDAPRAPRARQLEEVRDEGLVRGLLQDRQGLDPRLLVLVLQRGEGEVPGLGRRGDLLRLGDRLQRSGPQDRVAPGEGLAVDREGPVGGQVVRHLERRQLREVVPALGELSQETAEVASGGEVLQEALDAPAGGLRARPRHRDDGVEDRPVHPPPLQDDEAGGPELRRRVGGGPGHVLDLEVRHGLELLDEVFLLGVARPLVSLQLREDSRIRAEALLHHLEDHGLPSVRGMLAERNEPTRGCYEWVHLDPASARGRSV